MELRPAPPLARVARVARGEEVEAFQDHEEHDTDEGNRERGKKTDETRMVLPAVEPRR